VNWQAWSKTQAEQILELKRLVKRLRNERGTQKKRADLWRQRALRKKETNR
jgi:hypothetical protein